MIAMPDARPSDSARPEPPHGETREQWIVSCFFGTMNGLTPFDLTETPTRGVSFLWPSPHRMASATISICGGGFVMPQGIYPRKLAEERFWKFTDPPGDDDHWLWNGYRTRKGYGTFSISGRSVGAHRVSYEIHNGPIPDGMCVCHICDIPPCVNPAHLFLGSLQDNIADRHAKGRDAKGERHFTRTRPGAIVRGSTKRNAKLNEGLAVQIRHRYASGGVGMRALAREYDVSFTAIRLLISGKTWGHAV